MTFGNSRNCFEFAPYYSNGVSFVRKGKEAQTPNSEGEVGENVWSCACVKYLSSVSPQFPISPHMLNFQAFFFGYRKSKDFSEAGWQSVVVGCDNGTHFSMCAGSFLWVPSMTWSQSYKTPVVGFFLNIWGYFIFHSASLICFKLYFSAEYTPLLWTNSR